MKIGCVLLVAGIVAVLSGCATSPQNVALRPVVQVAETNIGAGADVGVTVVDIRADKSIGYRVTYILTGDKLGEIYTDSDVAQAFHEAIAQGLMNKGFKPVALTDGLARTLRVEVGVLEYSTSIGYLSGGVHIRAGIKVLATNNEKTYRSSYGVDNEKRVQWAPSAKTNERLINEAVSEVARKLLDDPKLMGFLAK